MLPVSLDCQFLIVHFVFSIVYLVYNIDILFFRLIYKIGIVNLVTKRKPHLEQELLTLPEDISPPPRFPVGFMLLDVSFLCSVFLFIILNTKSKLKRTSVAKEYIIPVREESWAHTTSLTRHFLFGVPLQSQESERWCMCVLVYLFFLFLRLWHFKLELFRVCGMFCSECVVCFVPSVWYFFSSFYY